MHPSVAKRFDMLIFLIDKGDFCLRQISYIPGYKLIMKLRIKGNF